MKRLLLILLMSGTIVAQAQQWYQADSSRMQHNLQQFTYVMIDSPDVYRTSEIINGLADHLFKPYSSVHQEAPLEYWVKFSLNTTTPFQNWLLVLKDSNPYEFTPGHDLVDAYFMTGGQMLLHKKTGINIPVSEKPAYLKPGYTAIEFSLPDNAEMVVYVRVKNLFAGSRLISYPVILHRQLAEVKSGLKVLLPVLSAIAGIFCLMSFFFYFFVREKAYLFFALYTLFLSQHYLVLHPDLPFIEFYIPENPQLIHGIWIMLTHGGFILFFLFGKYFIDLAAYSKKWNRYYMIFLAVWISALVTESLALMLRQQPVFPQAWLNYLALSGTLVFFTRFALFRSILSRIFLAGALWLLVFTLLGFLYQDLSLPFNPWPIGQVGQLLIYAAALAYKFRLNEKARSEATRIREMDEIRSRFFANISHEFRTPLTLIQGPLSQIEENARKNDEAVPVPLRHIRTMRRNTDRMLDLVNQLLDLSRLDSGKMNLTVIQGDVLQLLKAVANSYDSMAERKGIHYHLHFPEGSLIGFFDRDKMEKIISNLLGNALKYTSEGGTVSLDVSVEDNRLRMAVSDNGPGIGKKELDKIFDRFYRVENSDDKGSGIGLALVKELVDLYRGQISVSSEPGKGSRFKVSLPMEKAAFRENEFLYGEWKSDAGSTQRYAEKKEEVVEKLSVSSSLPLILVVEDNSDLRNFIRESLEQQCQVMEAVDGGEGMEKALAEIPDLVISDVMMPVMDGFQLAAKLKKDERTCHIPIILLTAKAGQQHKLQGLETGADDYLTKPFDAMELRLRIQNLIHQRKVLRKKFAGTLLLKPAEIAVSSSDENFLKKIMQIIEENMGEEVFGVESLAKDAAMSRSQLHRKLVALTGKAPSEILRNTRLLRARELLQKRSATPSEVAFQVGFSSHAYFSKCFKEEFGMSPSEVR